MRGAIPSGCSDTRNAFTGGVSGAVASFGEHRDGRVAVEHFHHRLTTSAGYGSCR
jgi:hypothetical protein